MNILVVGAHRSPLRAMPRRVRGFRAGHFLVTGDRQARIHPAQVVGPETAAEIAALVVVGRERTPTQDLEFSVRHLVEVALRGLSPSINDPFTAVAPSTGCAQPWRS